MPNGPARSEPAQRCAIKSSQRLTCDSRLSVCLPVRLSLGFATLQPLRCFWKRLRAVPGCNTEIPPPPPQNVTAVLKEGFGGGHSELRTQSPPPKLSMGVGTQAGIRTVQRAQSNPHAVLSWGGGGNMPGCPEGPSAPGAEDGPILGGQEMTPTPLCCRQLPGHTVQSQLS